MKKLFAASTYILALVACGESGSDPEAYELGASALNTPAERQAVLDLVNDPKTDFVLLDDAVGLDRRAARWIIEYRNGYDGVAGTRDDEPFRTIEELDAVPYVGLAALRRLLDHAKAAGYLRGESMGPEAREKKTLALVNDPAVNYMKLDNEVGLDRRAASAIVEYRVGRDGRAGTSDDRLFRSLSELDALPYVGESALTKLLEYAVANGY